MLYIFGVCMLLAGAAAAELYVSVADGDDTTGTGSFDQPYKTIAKAMAEITPGDACIIREGVYREVIAPQVDDIYIGPFEEDDVEINGCDIVTNSWSDYEGDIKTLPAPEQVWQIFVGGKRMRLARFPDMGEESTLLSTDKNNYLSSEIIMPPTPDRSIVDFPATTDYPTNFFKGAVYTGRHGKNPYTACSGTIKGSTNGVLEVFAYGHRQWNRRNTTRFGSGSGYIINCLNVLDAVEEWYWSAEDELLYFYPPAEVAESNAVVEVRHRLWGLDLRNRTDVVVEGLRFQAASVRLDDAVGCEVNHCEILYMAPWSPLGETDYGGRLAASCGVYVSGQTNRLWRNYIAHSWGGGVRMEGSDNILEQCLIEDIGWIGRRTSGVQLWGERNHALRNVIQKVGNSGFDGGQRGFGIGRFGRESDVRYNHVQYFGYLSSHDVGAYYVNTQGYPAPVKQVISYNTLFNYMGPGSKLAPGAVYSDNGTHGVIAHHNYSKLTWRKRNPVNVVYRDNSTTQVEGAPVLGDEGIAALLTDTNSCPPVDAGALFDAEVSNPGGDPEAASNMVWVILDDRIDYTEAELREIFPAPNMDAWLAEVNYAPSPVGQNLFAEADTPLAITLTATDDQFGDDLVYTVTSGPTRGSLSGDAPNLIYAPDAGYTGSDSFAFTAYDGIATSAVATVSIEVITEGLKTIAYTFETRANISGATNNIVYTAPDVNTFGAGVAAGDLELYDGTQATDYGRFTDLGGGSVEAAVNDRSGSSPASFSLAIGDTVAVDLTNMTFDTSYRCTLTGNTTVEWDFYTIVEGVTNNMASGGFTHTGGANYQSPASASGNIALTGLASLSDTVVEFVWELTGSRVNTFGKTAFGLDDIVLTGTMSPVPQGIVDFGIGALSGGTNVVLSWQAESGSSYGVKATTNLVTGPWVNVATNVAGMDGVLVITNTPAEDQQYFQVYCEE
ncbi:Ig-like domain-containing protein [Pontiellaceae bacterium B12227]|nr:Ig-like domain-containing protein [Pontiellaceae bacterium B12227]